MTKDSVRTKGTFQFLEQQVIIIKSKQVIRIIIRWVSYNLQHSVQVVHFCYFPGHKIIKTMLESNSISCFVVSTQTKAVTLTEALFWAAGQLNQLLVYCCPDWLVILWLCCFNVLIYLRTRTLPGNVTSLYLSQSVLQWDPRDPCCCYLSNVLFPIWCMVFIFVYIFFNWSCATN